MSTLTPIPLTLLTRLTGLPRAGNSTRLKLKFLLHQPALARNIVEKACARSCALEAMEARR
jgi:hypothetical protein